MLRPALVIALMFAASCQKQQPQGDLPPVVAPPPVETGPASGSAAAPANPHGGMGMANPSGANPHAGMGMGESSGANPHAGMGMGDPSGANPHAGMAGTTAPTALEKQADGRFALGPFTVAIPASWTAKPVTSSMRVADLVVVPDTELIVYYFGPDGAGSVEVNFDRWVSQFSQADGKPSKDVAKVDHAKFAGQNASLLSVSGHFSAQAMPGGPGSIDKDNQAMLGAIVDSPKGPYYFKLVGPKASVDGVAGPFRAMLDSLKLR